MDNTNFLVPEQQYNGKSALALHMNNPGLIPTFHVDF